MICLSKTYVTSLQYLSHTKHYCTVFGFVMPLFDKMIAQCTSFSHLVKPELQKKVKTIQTGINLQSLVVSVFTPDFKDISAEGTQTQVSDIDVAYEIILNV